MPAHQLLHEKQFAFSIEIHILHYASAPAPAGDTIRVSLQFELFLMLTHLFQHEKQFQFPSNTLSSFQLTWLLVCYDETLGLWFKLLRGG